MGGAGGTASISSSSTTARCAPAYSATLAFANNPVSSPRFQGNLQQILTQAPALQASPGIRVALDGSTVVLQGWAADEHDRILAENMVRLNPGVRDVRNDVQVANLTPQTTARTTQPTGNGP